MNKKTLLLIIALLFTSFIVYSPHVTYTLPFHLDEWTHISNVVRIHEEGFSYFLNHSPVEFGFDLILLFISFFTDLIAIYHLLPVINAIVIAGVLFYFLKRQFNFWVGLFSIIFLASLKSNVNVLGLWFYVPVIGNIVLVYTCLFFLEQSQNKPQKIYWISLLLFLIAFIHPSSFLVIFLVTLIYLSFHHKFVIKHKHYFIPFLALFFPIIVMFVFFSNGLTNIWGFFGHMTWGRLEPQINFNPVFFYGILLSIFALIGFYFCYKKKKLLPFRIYALVALINLSLFPLLDFTIFSSYQRYTYHFMIASIPLSAIGFFYMINIVSSFLKKRNIRYIVIFFIVLFSLVSIFSGYYDLPENAKLYYSVTYDEYRALQSLQQYPPGRILTSLGMGSATKAISGHEPVFTYFEYKKREEVNKFYEADCDLKKEFLINNYLIKGDITYIHANETLDCLFLTELYSSENNFIYEINLGKNILFFLKNASFKEKKDGIIVKAGNFIGNKFTFHTWVYPQEESLVWSRIVHSAFANIHEKSGWFFDIDKGRLVVGWGNLKKYHQIYSDSLLKAKEWNFIALTYDGNFSLYINGNLDKTIKADYLYSISDPYRQMLIGGITFHANMSRMTLENRSLSSQEINEIYTYSREVLIS